MFDPGLDLIEINILTKFQEDCIKTEVYKWFSKIWPCDLAFDPM